VKDRLYKGNWCGIGSIWHWTRFLPKSSLHNKFNDYNSSTNLILTSVRNKPGVLDNKDREDESFVLYSSYMCLHHNNGPIYRIQRKKWKVKCNKAPLFSGSYREWKGYGHPLFLLFITKFDFFKFLFPIIVNIELFFLKKY
jgi:hypothetical protein